MLGSSLYLVLILAPLVTAIINGCFGFMIKKWLSHSLAILGVLISTGIAWLIFYKVQYQNLNYNGDLYTWLQIGSQSFHVGILIDKLTSIMLVVVTSVSLMVHIYTIGYMAHEEGYQRFFSYISLFTFMMLMLVLSNNFVQLFFGWEGVGLVSYLLIGFYFKRQSAVFANLKAFLINRIGDFGFLLGIGLVLAYCGSLDYNQVFAKLPDLVNLVLPGTSWHLITVIGLLLFVGAMGKSAQFPLHVWLPDSMEGPTPISALIHAATMVTAGIFMVARLSPLYNLSATALSTIMIIGSINCLFLGILGVIQNDIKRVVAYSTLSQLGYMVVALGSGAYSIAVFHLMTHAFFKGLLFLGAGSVIVAMHHEQDMRKMGGLAKYMPITYMAILIGSLALAGIPPFAGFFSKDMILESVRVAYEHGVSGSGFALFSVYASVFVTALYSFRLIFMTFHGEERFGQVSHHLEHDSHAANHHAKHTKVTESPWVITLPLILMTLASIVAGWLGFEAFVSNSILSGSVVNASNYVNSIQNLGISSLKMVLDSFTELPVYLALLGILTAYVFYKKPQLSTSFIKAIHPIYTILERKYYMDDLYLNILAPIARSCGRLLWNMGEIVLIDGIIINGSAKFVGWLSRILGKIQSGFVNSYATFMVLGIIVLLSFCTQLIFN